jgi:hypothetical protein
MHERHGPRAGKRWPLGSPPIGPYRVWCLSYSLATPIKWHGSCSTPQRPPEKGYIPLQGAHRDWSPARATAEKVTGRTDAGAPHTQRLRTRGRAAPGVHASGRRPSTRALEGCHDIDGSPQHGCRDRPPRGRDSPVEEDHPACPGLGMSPARTTEGEADGHDACD